MCRHYFAYIVCQNQSTARIEVITKERNYVYDTNMKTQYSLVEYTGRKCSFLTSATILGVQMSEMSKLGLLIDYLPVACGRIPCISVRGVWFNLKDPLFLPTHSVAFSLYILG